MYQAALRWLPRSFAVFAFVGAIGLVVDIVILSVLVHGYGWGDYTARVVSTGSAMTTTWLLNRRYAFPEGATRNKRREYTRYVIAHGCGILINFAVYGACLNASSLMDDFPVLAALVGSATAMMFNYFAARWWVFTGDEAT